MTIGKKKERKCVDCAFRSHMVEEVGAHDGIIFSDSFAPLKINLNYCRANKLALKEHELKTKSCDKFLRKKEGMSLEQQLNSKFSSRFRRNWKFVVEFAGLIGVIVAIVEVYLLLIHW